MEEKKTPGLLDQINDPPVMTECTQELVVRSLEELCERSLLKGDNYNDIEYRAQHHLNRRRMSIAVFVDSNNLTKDVRKYINFHCYNDYMQGAAEQKAIDHSEEHLRWIIKQYHSWMNHNWHTPIGSHCTFKEWIDKKLKEE